MQLALAAVFAAPGLAVGSFLNVVASRLPLHRSAADGRSACMSCDAPIRAYDNLPLVSYAILRGRCRDCGEPIPVRYPIVEALTAALVVACILRFGFTADAFVAAFFCAVLVVISAIDIEQRIVPNKIVLPALVYPAGLGMGDVKLALLLGAMLGAEVAVAMAVGLLAAVVPSVVLLAMKGSAARKMALPFAPFLALGGLVALFAGEPLLDWYLGVMG